MGTDLKPTHYQKLLQQELTRKQFLQVLGVMIVSVLGFNNLFSMISKLSRTPGQERASTASKHGFGSSKFGA